MSYLIPEIQDFLYFGTIISGSVMCHAYCLQELYPPQAWRWLEEEFEIAPKRHEDENFGWYKIVSLFIELKVIQFGSRNCGYLYWSILWVLLLVKSLNLSCAGIYCTYCYHKQCFEWSNFCLFVLCSLFWNMSFSIHASRHSVLRSLVLLQI